MDLYVSTHDVAEIMRWRLADFAALRRTLRPALKISRPRSRNLTKGRGCDRVELTSLLEFLDRITGGLDRRLEANLIDKSSPLT